MANFLSVGSIPLSDSEHIGAVVSGFIIEVNILAAHLNKIMANLLGEEYKPWNESSKGRTIDDNLFSPESGNVVFECRNIVDGKSEFLYASNSILSKNSLYYSTSSLHN